MCHVLADVQYRHVVDDELLRFFDNCRNYVEGVDRNRTALQEVEKFKHGEEMEALRRRTAKKLGIPQQQFTTGLTHTIGAAVSWLVTQQLKFVPLCFL